MDPETITAIREHDLDVVVRFGWGILTSEALRIARHGIWSYHHGDPEQFRGAPPGFWEIVHGAPVTGAILQRLEEKLDAGKVLERASFNTLPGRYARSLDHALFGSAPMLARALKRLLLSPDGCPPEETLEQVGKLYRTPRNGDLMRFLRRTTQAKIVNLWSALFRHQQWSIGVLEKVGPAELLSKGTGEPVHATAVTWLPEPKGRFLADPSIAIGSDRTVLAEDFNWSTGVGTLSSIRMSSEPVVQPVLALKEHLSYPFVFESEQRTYCIPENGASGACRLFELRDGQLAVSRTLIDLPLVDPTLVQHQGRWWLFCTMAGEFVNEALYAFHADHLGGEWQAHALNPIKIDIRSARPAGSFFRIGDLLIRPAQDCAGGYGKAVVLHKVTELTPDTFAESRVAQLLPDPDGPYPDGLHTLSFNGRDAIIDGARRTFILAETKRAIAARLRLNR